jgi:hypothetical protein
MFAQTEIQLYMMHKLRLMMSLYIVFYLITYPHLTLVSMSHLF